MPLSSQTGRIVVLTGLSKFTSSLLKVGQMEAAKVWHRCQDAQQSAMKERTKLPHRDMLHQRMSQWEYGKDIEYLDYKSEHAGISRFSGSERGASSRCPKWAISTNLQAGTGSRRLVDLGAIAIWSAASTCMRSRFKTKRRSPYRKMSRIYGPVLAVGST